MPTVPTFPRLWLTSRTPFATLFAGAALLSAACGPKLAPPPSFGELAGGAYDYRAATPHGVVIAARSEPNKPRANIAFWSRAVDARLARDGYQKKTEAPVATERGLPGVELHYAHEAEGRAYEYVVALFVKEDRVYLVEAAGDKEDFVPATADVDRAIRSLRE
jgi:hypothetical protein